MYFVYNTGENNCIHFVYNDSDSVPKFSDNNHVNISNYGSGNNNKNYYYY